MPHFHVAALLIGLQQAFNLSHAEGTGNPVYPVPWELAFHKLPKSYPVGPTLCEWAF